MKVIFKGNKEPCIQYEVKNSNEVIEFNEMMDKYAPHIEIETLGLVPKELLTEATHPDNINATDIAVYLTNG
jgi:hypothetical protein